MQFCVTCPPVQEVLEKVASKYSYHMVLAQYCLESDEYLKFYQRQVQHGSVVILDHGEAEGKQLGSKPYATLIEELCPTAYVLPDVIGDSNETLKRSRAFVRDNPGLPGKRIFVYHGGEGVPYFGLQQDNWIGLPKWWGKQRRGLIHKFEGFVRFALGFIDEDPMEEIRYFQQNGGIAYIDSKVPVFYGLKDMSIPDVLTPFGCEVTGQMGNITQALANVEGVRKLLDECVEIREHFCEPLQNFKHTSSSIKPRFGLIPYGALKAVAARFELGEKKHAGKAWNALTNQVSLEDDDWILARAEHIIHHAYTFIQKFKGLIPDDGDDDAAAIIWGGMLLSEAMRIRKERNADK